ncbi:MAG: sugar phosphate isomerase/epimerase family protein [Candidatus Aminicenantales bacterium]|jgi:xylose isomerase
MTKDVRYGLITSFVGKTKDRFQEYNADLTLEQKMALASKMKGMSGVEVVFPYEVKDGKSLTPLLKKYGLAVAAVNVNVKAEPEFRNGGLSSRDAAVRKKAVQFIKDAKDFSQIVGADKVTCCPLGDGYEFAFQCDYAQMWKYLVETLGEAGDYKKEIPLFIEYKPSEIRGHCFVDTAAKTLCLLNDIGIGQMGVTIDYGHSKYGQENPAEIVSILANSRYPYYIHINDNNGRWDWDYMVASHNFLEYAEFLFYLQEFKYKGFLTSDTSPTRWDIVGTFKANIRMTQKIWDRLLSLDRARFRKLLRAGNFLETWKFVEKFIFRL